VIQSREVFYSILLEKKWGDLLDFKSRVSSQVSNNSQDTEQELLPFYVGL
jgi:hypothetical protein